MAPKTDQVRRIADATLQSNYNAERFHISANFIDAVPGLVTPIQIGKDTFSVKVLAMDHSVPTAGYCISRATSRLNPELQPYKDSLEPPLFACLMKCLRTGQPLPSHLKGLVNEPLPTDITVELWHPQFCFLTDTSIKGIVSNIDTIKEYPIIIVECTFYDKDDVDHALKKKHIHWVQLESFIRIYCDSLWVLVHSSTRYKDQAEILTAIASNDKPDTKLVLPSNCLLWI
jgi:ribonuclease Z